MLPKTTNTMDIRNPITFIALDIHHDINVLHSDSGPNTKAVEIACVVGRRVSTSALNISGEAFLRTDNSFLH